MRNAIANLALAETILSYSISMPNIFGAQFTNILAICDFFSAKKALIQNHIF